MFEHLPLTNGIYRILNVKNGKSYIGSASSNTIRKRCRDHHSALEGGKHANRHLQAAWRKWGATAFRFEVVEACAPVDCIVREQFWMDCYGAASPARGYNLCPVAGSLRGLKHSPESRAKKSETSKRVAARPEVRKKRSAAMKERWADEKYRSKTLAAHRKASTPEVLAKRAAGVRKTLADPVVREKMSLAQRKRPPRSSEARAKMSESAQGTWADPGIRAKRLKGMRKKLSDPATRQRLSEARRKVMADPARRAKASATCKKMWANGQLGSGTVEAARKATLRKTMSDPEYRKKVADKTRALWSDPAYRAKVRAARSTPAAKAKRSQALRAAWARRKAKKAAEQAAKQPLSSSPDP